MVGGSTWELRRLLSPSGMVMCISLSNSQQTTLGLEKAQLFRERKAETHNSTLVAAIGRSIIIMCLESSSARAKRVALWICTTFTR